MNKSTLIDFKREMVDMLLAQDVDINAKRTSAGTPPDSTASSASSTRVGALPVHGAEARAGESCVNASLHAAAHTGKRNVVEVLLANGFDIEARDNNGNTPLNWAVPYGH